MKKIILLIFTLCILCSCTQRDLKVDTSTINVFDDLTNGEELDLHAGEYMVIDMSDFDILYAKDNDKRMYPASLTKLLTMDTVLNLTSNLQEVSYYTKEQYRYLVEEDASMAYLQREYFYSLYDLLYALILPSGADAALAIENFYDSYGIDLIEEMNLQAQRLGCKDSHFVNSTGLHDDDHYTTLDDLFLVVMDLLKFEEGREILQASYRYLEDGTLVRSTIGLTYRDMDFKVLGGKTGYTPESGQSIIALCKNKGKYYLVMAANAYGKYALNQYWHYEDVISVFDYLNQ